MKSAEKNDEHMSSATGSFAENELSTQKKRRSKDITELKAEAEGLKESLSSLTTEDEKSQNEGKGGIF